MMFPWLTALRVGARAGLLGEGVLAQARDARLLEPAGDAVVGVSGSTGLDGYVPLEGPGFHILGSRDEDFGSQGFGSGGVDPELPLGSPIDPEVLGGLTPIPTPDLWGFDGVNIPDLGGVLSNVGPVEGGLTDHDRRVNNWAASQRKRAWDRYRARMKTATVTGNMAAAIRAFELLGAAYENIDAKASGMLGGSTG